MSVETISTAFSDLHAKYEMIDTVFGGTESMRKAKQYLPQWPLENDESYKHRLDTATLYPALRETVKQMTGRVFFKPIDRENIADSLKDYIHDIDLEGNNLDIFFSKVFKDALKYGVSFVVVDYSGNGDAKTQAEEKNQGARPFATIISPKQVLGYRTAMINGQKRITQFRYKQIINEPSVESEFMDEDVEEIIVLDIGRCRKYRKTKDGYVLHEDIELKANHIPLSITNVVMLELDTNPPLMDLCYLNIKHWQSQSDQDTILHTARVPLLALKTDVETDDDFQISGSLARIPVNSDIFYVEHSGAAITAGQTSLEQLELQMQAAGAKLLVRTRIALTDSQAKEEQGKEISLLRLYANYLEDMIAQVLDLFSIWMGRATESSNVEISGNIDADIDSTASMDRVIQLSQVGVISQQTAFEEAKRRGIVSELLDWEEEQIKINSQGVSDDLFQTGL